MGNKAAKQYYLKRKYGVAGSEENSSDEDLAEILAALSCMTQKGEQAPQPAAVTRDDLSLVGLHRQGSSTRATSTPTRSSRALREKRKRMVRSRAVSDDSMMQRSQPDRNNSQDWAEMREWLLWCMQSSLKDDLEMYGKNRVENQSSFESNAET